jgi:hypothetical protein
MPTRAPRRPPQLRTPRPDDVSGRGLLLLDEFVDRWAHDTVGGPAARPRTKGVWAETADCAVALYRPGNLTILQGAVYAIPRTVGVGGSGGPGCRRR